MDYFHDKFIYCQTPYVNVSCTFNLDSAFNGKEFPEPVFARHTADVTIRF